MKIEDKLMLFVGFLWITRNLGRKRRVLFAKKQKD